MKYVPFIITGFLTGIAIDRAATAIWNHDSNGIVVGTVMAVVALGFGCLFSVLIVESLD